MPLRLLHAARRLEPLDLRLARDTYLDALSASLVAGPLAKPGGRPSEIAGVARSALPPPRAPEPRDLLLDGLAMMIFEGRPAAGRTLRRAVDAFLGDRVSAEDWLQCGLLGSAAALALWDFTSWAAVGMRHLEHARTSGALTLLGRALDARRVMAVFFGDLETATSLRAEEAGVTEATGARQSSYADLLLAAYQGPTTDLAQLVAATADDAVARGEGLAVHHAHWATALRNNGLGQYALALPAANQATGEDVPFVTACALPELVEAAARSGEADVAADALRRLSAVTAVDGSDWAAGIQARARALLSAGPDAERDYADAVARLGRTPLRLELARAHLLYGEWLRRENRRIAARHQLRTAHDLFTATGADVFAERARRELVATGEKVRKRDVDTDEDLTPQEEHIARLARAGRTNPEIGAELFISSRTVEWHLRKIFIKLGITSRKDLSDAFPRQRRAATHRIWQN